MKNIFNNLTKQQTSYLLMGVAGIIASGVIYYVLVEKKKPASAENLQGQSLSSAAFFAGPEEPKPADDKVTLYKEELKAAEEEERLSSENIAHKAFFGGGESSEAKPEETAEEKLAKLQRSLDSPGAASTASSETQDSKENAPARATAPKPQKKKAEPAPTEPLEVKPQKTFYTLKKEKEGSSEPVGATPVLDGVRCIVHNEQTIQSGDVLRVRILDQLIVNGVTIEENTILYGSVSFSRDRVNVVFVNAQLAGRLIPLNKKAYGTDGMAGLMVGDLGGAELTNQAINDGISSTTRALTGSRALGNASRGVVNERKEEKVTLPNEYQFLIK